jgi:hypothetical protein
MILLLSVFVTLSSTLIPQSKLNVSEFLPAGAKLETQVMNPVLADFDGDGVDDAVLFFTLGEVPNRRRRLSSPLRTRGDYFQLHWADRP